MSKDFADYLEPMTVERLAELEGALIRERVIRDGMARTGEDRQTMADFFDAHASMEQEAVLSLTDGEPTTLADALRRYVDSLAEADEGSQIGVDGVINHLEALLAYPWPGEVDTLQS